MRFGRRVPAGQRRGARLRRRGLPPRGARQHPRPDPPRARRGRSSTTARPTAPARSPTSTPPATRGSGSCTPTTTASARPATRGCGTSRGDLLAFADSDDVVPPDGVRRAAAPAAAHRRRTSSPGRSPAGTATGSPSCRGCGGCTGPARRSRSRATRRSSATCSRGTSCSAATSGTGAGLAWPERVRYEDQPTTTRAYVGRPPLRRDPGRRLPLADPARRLLDHPAALLARRPARPVDDQADVAGDRRRASAPTKVREVFVDRVLAGDLHRYFVEIPGCSDEWWDLLVAGRPGVLGRPLAGALRAAAGAPAHRLAGARWTAARTPPR